MAAVEQHERRTTTEPAPRYLSPEKHYVMTRCARIETRNDLAGFEFAVRSDHRFSDERCGRPARPGTSLELDARRLG